MCAGQLRSMTAEDRLLTGMASRFRERINLCVFTHSLVDLLFVLQAFSLFYFDRLYNYLTGRPSMGVSIMFFSKQYMSPNGLFYLSTISRFISALIASERCFCVVSPLTSKTVLKTKSSAAILLLSSVVILAGGVLVGMKWDAVCVKMHYMNSGGGGVVVQDRLVAGDNTSTDVVISVLYFSTPATTTTTTITGTSTTTTITTITIFTVYPSQFYLQHTQLIDMLDIFLYGMAIPFFCFTVVIATTIVTVIKLRNTAAWRGRSSSSASSVARSNKETALTRMLVETSVLFIVLATPVVSVRVVMLILLEFNVTGRYVNLFFIMLDLSVVSSYISASVNFFVYYSLGTRFRRSVNDLFGKTSKHKDAAQ